MQRTVFPKSVSKLAVCGNEVASNAFRDMELTIHCRLRELILILTDADCIATFRPVPAKASYSAAPLGCLNVSMPRIGRELLVPSFHDFWSVAAWDRTPTSPATVGGSATESLRPDFQLRD